MRPSVPALVLAFSLLASAALADTFQVTTATDSGSGSLRQAITDANVHPGPDVIAVQTTEVIRVRSALPFITDPVRFESSGGTYLDGTDAGKASGLVFRDAMNSYISRITVSHFQENGIVIRGGSGAIVDGALLTGNGGAGLLVDWSSHTFISFVTAEENEVGFYVRGGSANIQVISARRNRSDGARFENAIADLTRYPCRFDPCIRMGSTFSSNGGGGLSSEGSTVSLLATVAEENEGDGIRLDGGSMRGSLRSVSRNHRNGVSIVHGSAFLSGSVYSNDRMNIDLADDGPTANDPLDADDGPDGLMNAPSIVAATTFSYGSSERVVRFEGTVDSTPNTNLVVDLYTSSECRDSALGEGEQQVGSVGVVTDGNGHASFRKTLYAGALWQYVAATVTGREGTSEFSRCVTSVAGSSATATDLTLSVTPEPVRVAPGGLAKVTLHATNHGGSALGFSPNLGIPSDGSVIAAGARSDDGSCQSYYCEQRILAPGDSWSWDFYVLIDPSVPAGTDRQMTVGGYVSNPNDHTDTESWLPVTISVRAAEKPAVDLSLLEDEHRPDGAYIAITNNGAIAVGDGKLRVDANGRFMGRPRFVGRENVEFYCADQPASHVVCALPLLRPGESVRLTLTSSNAESRLTYQMEVTSGGVELHPEDNKLVVTPSAGPRRRSLRR